MLLVGTIVSPLHQVKFKKVNCKAAMAFREIRRHESVKMFTTFMDMYPPMTSRNYQRLFKQKLIPAYKDLAAREVRDILKDGAEFNEIIDCSIAIDGTCNIPSIFKKLFIYVNLYLYGYNITGFFFTGIHVA